MIIIDLLSTHTGHFTGSTGLHRTVQRSLCGDPHLSLESFLLLINWAPSAKMILCQLVQFENICYPFILLAKMILCQLIQFENICYPFILLLIYMIYHVTPLKMLDVI